MDTSETYKKMCDCEEIQKADRDADRHNYFCNGIFLPRQDQLQEMAFTAIDGTYNKLPTKVFAFSDYWEENGIPIEFFSLEQLWLAFVMKELYKKTWNGEKWST